MSDDLRTKLEAMVTPKGICEETGCTWLKEKGPGQRRCYWHKLAKRPMQIQKLEAEKRRSESTETRRTIANSEWPAGYRYCSGCSSMVPIWYCGTASRCKPCTSSATQRSIFGLTVEQQKALNDMSEGKCMGCGKHQRYKSLATDHSHFSGDVRGLLEQECNQVIGDFHDDPVRFLRLAVYLLNPPSSQIGIGNKMGRKETIDLVTQMTEQILNERKLG